MAFTLVGFIADLNGSEADIFEAAPVVRSGGILLAAKGLDWTANDLAPVAADVAKSYHPVPYEVDIRAGQTVWIAGRSFVDGIRDCSFVEAFELGAWPTGARGARISLGSRRAFDDLIRRFRHQLEVALNVALFDASEMFIGDAGKLFALYSALPVTPDVPRQMQRALYFDRIRDNYSVAVVRAETVYTFGLVATEREFDSLLRQRIDDLNRPRAGEAALPNTLTLSAPVPASSDFALLISGIVGSKRATTLEEKRATTLEELMAAAKKPKAHIR